MGAIYSKGGTEKAGDLKKCAVNAIPPGWLKANGAAVNRVTYSALFGVIGTTFGAGDGSTTFNLPDYRGEFLRGFDDGRGVDSGRVIGSAQAADIAPHTHTMWVYSDGSGGIQNASPQNASPGAVAGTRYTGSVGGAETRPRNVAALICIKY